MGPDDTLWLTDYGDHTVRHCTLDGKVLLTLGIPGAPKPYMSGEPFHRCTHTALSPEGDLYVSDGYGNSRVHKYAPNGTLLRSWGEPGTDPGQFNIPHNICCDADGWVYVADRENHRVQVFDGNGKFETQWINMHRPSGLFMERGGQGRFYIGEIGGGMGVNYDMPNIGPRVSIHSHKGELLARLGQRRPDSSRASSSRRTGSPSTRAATSTWARCRSPTGAIATRASHTRRGSGVSRSWCVPEIARSTQLSHQIEHDHDVERDGGEPCRRDASGDLVDLQRDE